MNEGSNASAGHNSSETSADADSSYRDSESAVEFSPDLSPLMNDLTVADIEFDVEDLLDFGEEAAIDIIRMRYKDEEGAVKTSEIEERLLRSKLPERVRRELKRKLRAVRTKLTKETLERIVRRVEQEYEDAKVEPNEAVGIVAAQSIGEPGTQMSLPGDERIILCADGGIFSVRIGDFVDACISKYGAYDVFGAEICDMLDDFFVLSLNDCGKLQWKRIKCCIRHKFDGELLKLGTKSGRKITATPYHSFVTKRNGRVVPIAGSTLKPGDRIPVIRRLPLIDARLSETNSGGNVREDALLLGRMFYERESMPEFVLNADESFIRAFLHGFFTCASSTSRTFESTEFSEFTAVSESTAVEAEGSAAEGSTEGSIKSGINSFENTPSERSCERGERIRVGADGAIEVRFTNKHVMDDFALLLARLGIFSVKRCESERCERGKRGGNCGGGEDWNENNENNDEERGVNVLVIPAEEASLLECCEHLLNQRSEHRQLEHCQSEHKRLEHRQSERRQDEEDVIWDEIASIERVRFADYVYDISVDGLETFTTHDGIITHNTMRTFHYAGVGALYVTMGLPRIMEIMDARKKPSTPTMKIKLMDEYAHSREKAEEIAAEIEETRTKDIAKIEVSLDEKCVYVLLKPERMAERRVRREEVEEKIRKLDVEIEQIGDDILKVYPKEESYYELLRLEERIADMLIKGIEGIKRVLVRKDEEDGEYTLFTEGSALKKVMRIDGVDPTRTTTSNIIEIAEVLGIEAARNAIIEEITNTLEDQNLDVDPRHIALIADAMTMDGEVKQIGRHGLAGEKASVLSRAAFEVTVEHLLEAALRGERDELLGITENVIVGQPIRLGTGAVELVAKISPLKRTKNERSEE